MTTTFVSSDSIGAGIRFTFSASGDSLVVLPGVTIGSTNAAVFSGGAFSDHEITVLGTMVSALQVALATNSSFVLGAGGNFINFEPNSLSAGLFLNGTSSLAQIDGTFSSPEAIGLLTNGGGNTITVTGSVSAASGVFLGLSGSSGDILVNSGGITANAIDDAVRNTRFNNGVYTEGADTRITNLAGGEITGTSSEGAGARFGVGSNGSSVVNHGTITSVLWAGVDLDGIGLLGTATLVNTGLIEGKVASVYAPNAAGALTIQNSGQLIGDVFLGSGNDSFDGQGGRIDGDWSGRSGEDRYDGRGASVITGTINGGNDNDTLLGGDGDETIFGDSNDDTVRGGGGDDVLSGGIGNDTMAGNIGDDELAGEDGNDTVHGGRGEDRITGGVGIDSLIGGSEDDEILGESQKDGLNGSAGDDLLDGGSSADTLTGGRGADVFVLVSTVHSGVAAGTRDIVTDFISGTDSFDLSKIDANTVLAGNQAFTFIGAAAFSNTAGELQYSAVTGLLKGDVDGNGTENFAVEFANLANLVAADFIL